MRTMAYRCETCRDLTRHKISDRWRRRVWLQVECGSHRKWERGAASGSLHRLVRCWLCKFAATHRTSHSRAQGSSSKKR
jgi:hypothetical protein